jgi:uncharacterized tellurite resistance protein B-like protein
MNKFNIHEKKIIIAILIAIMYADGVIHPNETEYLDSVINAFGLNLNDLDCIDDWDFSLIKKEFKSFNDDKKRTAINMFLEMSKCDGYADPREIEIIKNLG